MGTLIYYGLSLDPTMLLAVNEIPKLQSKSTEKKNKNTDIILDYASNYPNTSIQYHASEMVLHIDSYAAYLIFPNGRSWTHGNYLLRIWLSPDLSKPNPKQNGLILTEVKSIKNVISLAAESETADMFSNEKTDV